MGTVTELHPERLSDGRRKGNHGARASQAIRASVVQALSQAQAAGTLTGALMVSEAERANVDRRTVQRWWSEEVNRKVERATAQAEATGTALSPWLCRHRARGKALELTQEELSYIASFLTVELAIDAIRSSDTHRLSAYGRSTIYRAWDNIPYSLREGLKKGAKAQRAAEMTFPLPYLHLVNEVHTIDEYDLKVRALDELGNEVQPKLLVVRENASGLLLAWLVLTQAATSADARRVLGAAVVGWMREGIEVFGPARMLRCDQGGNFLSEEVMEAMLEVGTGMDPAESYAPQGNGAHEVMHKTLPDFIGLDAGSRRGHITRSGERLVHGLIPMAEVRRRVNMWAEDYNNHVYAATAGVKAGRSPWEVYKDLLAADEVYRLEVHDEQLARLAVLVCERDLDVTRGVRLNNRWFTGRRLATASKKGMKITLCQLLDDGVLYAFDRYGRFLDVLTVSSELTDETKAGILADRAYRSATTTNLAKDRAAAAVADADLLQAEAAHPTAADQSTPAPTPPSARTRRKKTSRPVEPMSPPVTVEEQIASFPQPRTAGDHDAS